MNPDTDGDGLSDLQEIRLRSDPLDSDEDDDGISDFYDTRKNFRITWKPRYPTLVISGTNITLDMGDSYDKDGEIVSHLWTIGSDSIEGKTIKKRLTTFFPFYVFSGVLE